MQKHQSNEVEFEDAEVTKLLKVLTLLEDAEEPEEAVFFGEDDRRMIQSIREHIERATGQST